MKRTLALLAPVGLLFTALITGCAAPALAAAGDTVTVNYTLTLDDGSIYYTTSGAQPAEYELGKNLLIPGFEKAVTGMRVGESKTVVIPPEDGYGPVRQELVQEVSLDRLPEGFEPAVGKTLQSTLNGTPVTVIIRDVTDSAVTVDANHALAGKNLTFAVELLSIEGAATDSILSRQPPLVWTLAVALMAVAAAFVVYIILTQRRLRLVTSGPAVQERRLLAEIARLDDDFEAGRIAETEYRKERTQRKAQIASLVKVSKG